MGGTAGVSPPVESGVHRRSIRRDVSRSKEIAGNLIALENAPRSRKRRVAVERERQAVAGERVVLHPGVRRSFDCDTAARVIMHMIAGDNGPVGGPVWACAEDPDPMTGDVQDLVFQDLVIFRNTIADVLVMRQNAGIGLAHIPSSDQPVRPDCVPIALNEDRRMRVIVGRRGWSLVLYDEALKGVIVAYDPHAGRGQLFGPQSGIRTRIHRGSIGRADGEAVPVNGDLLHISPPADDDLIAVLGRIDRCPEAEVDRVTTVA